MKKYTMSFLVVMYIRTSLKVAINFLQS